MLPELQRMESHGKVFDVDRSQMDLHGTHGTTRLAGWALIELHLTDPMLRWQEIEAVRGLAASPNSKLVFLGRGNGLGPILDLKDGSAP
jgi:hypothetical protein